MDKYLSQSSALFGSLKNAVLGNPVTREYQVGSQVGSFGPGLLWKVFSGKKKSTGQVTKIHDDIFTICTYAHFLSEAMLNLKLLYLHSNYCL